MNSEEIIFNFILIKGRFCNAKRAAADLRLSGGPGYSQHFEFLDISLSNGSRNPRSRRKFKHRSIRMIDRRTAPGQNKPRRLAAPSIPVSWRKWKMGRSVLRFPAQLPPISSTSRQVTFLVPLQTLREKPQAQPASGATAKRKGSRKPVFPKGDRTFPYRKNPIDIL